MGGDGTAIALAWLIIGETDGRTRDDEVKEMYRVQKCFLNIARETVELEYSWESEGVGKMEFAGIRDNAEYIKI